MSASLLKAQHLVSTRVILKASIRPLQISHIFRFSPNNKESMASAQELNELNEKLSKLPFLNGYEVSQADKDAFKKFDGTPFQHAHLMRWYKQMKFEMGGDQKQEQKTAPAPVKPALECTSGSCHSKDVNFDILPAKGVQRDAKTGQMKEDPVYVAYRLKMFDELFAAQEERIAAMPKNPIKVTLPDGAVKEGTSWETTPLDIAKSISSGLANVVVCAKVNGQVWDLTRKLEGDCSIELLKFSDKEGKETYWHSSAHILGECMERYFGGALCYGPDIEDGFYYDMWMGNTTISSEADMPKLEKLYYQMMKEKQPFQRLNVTKQQLIDMFKHNPFKQRLIAEKNIGDTTVYKCGNLIDMCRGPHLPHTGKAKACKLYKTSATYWEGKADQESLQRVYGITFPDKKQLTEWVNFQEEAKKRDHRRIGTQQELWTFDPVSAGSCFWLPRGAVIYNRLQDFIRSEYRKRGFKEVVTPNIFNSELWKTSGHWQHYEDDMFTFKVEDDKWAMKPMNCPGHCVMFGSRLRSYKELPLRFADFGVLHRNELSGALSGLTRVRRFQQDDAHIFCAREQIEGEITAALDFFKFVYDTFGFTFELNLSTRPEKYLGEVADWDEAEGMLKNALNTFCSTNETKWELNPGDGAFYGPKIDIKILDALKRRHQLATIQLDFQLPQRFKLKFVRDNKEETPVMIHRAILGSIERCVAILTESFGGKWPFWLSPRQVRVVPIGKSQVPFAQSIANKLFDAGLEAEADPDCADTFNYRIRRAQLEQWNFILVVGDKELEAGTCAVRTRDAQQHGVLDVDFVVDELVRLHKNRALKAEHEFRGEKKEKLAAKEAKAEEK